MRGYKPLFLTLFLLATLLLPVLAMGAPSYGEGEPYLGQVVDSYVNDDYVNETVGVIHNATLGVMELNHSTVPGFSDYENFTLYTESDEGGGIDLINATYLDMLMDRSMTRYVYYDFGVDNLQDWKMYGKFRLDYHDADAWSAFCMMSNYLGGEANHRDNTEPHIFWVIGGSSGVFRLYEYDDGGTFHPTPSKVMVDDTYFWFKMEKTGTFLEIDVYTTRVLRDAEGAGDWYHDNLTLTMDYNFRYFYPGNNYDDGLIKYLNMELYNIQFEGNITVYDTSGYYTTVDLSGGDLALALMYNGTIPANTAMTMEFYNGSSWVNHNNEPGHESLVDGLESVDVRDLYTTSLPVRVNQTTTDDEVTPRMSQLRLVTVTTISVVTASTAPYLAMSIILLMLGLALGMGIRR